MLGWLGLSYAQPPKKRLSLGVRHFCITHPDRPACQQWKKAVEDLKSAIKAVRKDIKVFCKEHPEDKFCKKVKERLNKKRKKKQNILED
ncbi:MAG: hypothetical protein J7M03_02840 [Candidatus Desulfofervidaceae bacterium]|nr:hypothetical protein [Candidatus Desulfofervidaceae bacterium]